MNSIHKTIIIIASILFCQPTANGQFTGCFNLDRLILGLEVGEAFDTRPGDTIARDNELILTAETFFDANGEPHLLESIGVQAKNFPNFYHGIDAVLAGKNINTKFDFMPTLDPIYTVQVYFYNSGQGVNFAFNNRPASYYPNFSSVPSQITPNTDFFAREVIPNTSVNGRETAGVFTIISRDPILNFTVGGENLVIDNICFSHNPDATCIIYNPMIISECDSAGNNTILLYGSHTFGIPSVEVEITGNGNNYGIQTIDPDQPIQFQNFQNYEPLPDVLEFNIRELGGSCSVETQFRKPICKAPDTCAVDNIVFDVNFCDTQGDFWADLSFDYGTQSDSFQLDISTGTHNLDLGNFAYANLPISVGPFSDTLLAADKNLLNWNVNISDLQDVTCRDEINVIDSVLCERFCVFEDLDIFDLKCVTDSLTGSYDSIRFSLNFDTAGIRTDSFQLYFSGQSAGIFNFDDLPLVDFTVKNIGGGMKSITVSEYRTGLTDITCQTTEYFRTPCLNCAENLTAELTFPPTPGGDYEVIVNMTPPAVGSRFELFIGATLIDTFSYTDLPISNRLNCTEFADSVTVSIRDLDILNCEVSTFYKVDCDRCDLPNFEARAIDCDGRSYTLNIDFDQVTTPTDVDVFVNGTLVGQGNTGDPIVIENLPTLTTQELEITICESGNNACCEEQIIPNPCAGFCKIDIRNAVATACDADGFFNIELDVEAVNPLGINFAILVNGDLQTTATYQPGIQSFVLGPFNGQTQDPFQIVIFDLLITNCTAELNLDSPNCNPNPCNISDIQAEITRCEGDNFGLNLFFNFANVASDSFELMVDNQPIGFYSYSDLPLNLNNLAHDGDGNIDIRVCDKDDAGCCDELAIDFTCDDCRINDFAARGIDCNLNQEFFFLLNGNISTAQTNDSFEIRVNGVLVKTIGNDDFAAFASTGIEVGPFDGRGGNVFEITIESRALPDCRAAIQSDFDCPPPPCVLSNLQLEAQPCDNNQEYLLDINFQFANTTSDSFLLTRNGIAFGKFAYADLPITVGPFFGNGNANVYIASDEADFNCRVDGSFISPNCPPPPCNITNLATDILACDADGNFEFSVNFNALNTVSNFFELVINGSVYDTYRFSQLPITAGPFSGDGSDYQILVRDAGNPACSDSGSFTAPNCPQPVCQITNLNIGAFACDVNDNFDVEVNFDYQNTASINFELLINGFLFGTYAYTDLPIIAQSLTGNGTNYTFTVRDADDFNCTEVTSFIAPDCTSDNCSISNFSATAGACDNDANFAISIDFDFQNMASDSFNLFTNGSLSATYAYTELPITTGLFPANGSILGFAVSDQTDVSCAANTTIFSPTCTPVPCVLSNFLAEAGNCDAQNQFMVDIDFNHAAASDSFLLFVNNSFYNTYAYSDLFIAVGPFDGDGSTLNFEVQDLDDTNCSLAGSLTSPDCTPCELTDISLRNTDCDLNGQFLFEIDFNFANTSDSFTLNLLGNSFERTYAYTELPVLAGPFDGDGSTVYPFMVSDSAEPNCNLNFSAIAPNCICSIRDVSAQTSNCDAGNFSIDLDFIFENTSDSFSVSAPGFTQNFAYVDLPVILGPFSGNGQTNTYLISDLVRTNCNDEFTLTAPDCTPPCSLTNPTIIANDCDNQGNFTATIDFDFSNTSSNFFNTNGYGIYAYADLPLTIPRSFVGDGVTDYTINITDGNDSICNLPMIIPAKYCGDSCQIYNVQATPSDCDGMGIFDLNLTFDSDNTNAAGFVVTVNGDIIGPLPYSTPQPLLLGSFFGDGQTSYNVSVLDAGDATCRSSVKVDPVNCLPCNLSDLTAQVTPCDSDGNFVVSINFTAQSGSPQGFSIAGNGINYGSYSYTDLPILLDSFAGDGTSVYEFVITDAAEPNCTIATTVGPVDCNTNNCRIFDLNALPTDCNLNGEFSVDLRFNYQDVGNSGFTVRGNGMVYGVFQYDQLPIRIDNLLGDGNTVYEFVVIDNDDPDCNNFTTVGPIDCDDTDCEITDLNVDILDCNGNGTYQVSINFSYNNPTNTLFDVFTTGGFFGTFPLDQLPLTIPNFPSNGNPFDAVRVCMTDDRLCCASVFFSTPDCDGDCIEFEALPYDTTFIGSFNVNAGDTILIENRVLMTSNVFLSATGPLLNSIAADSADMFFDAADGIQLTTHNATIDFKFPNFSGFPCREVTFNYFQQGDVNNISINGQPVQVFDRFEDLPFNIATAVIAEIFPTNAREGVLKLKGFINEVRIGGEELAFDNICYGECVSLTDVWPGDINLDNWVSHLDILNLGIAFEGQGPERADQTTDWEELPADDWLRYFGRGQNYKHSDCNGDGLVDERDLDVMEDNYGEFHDMILPIPIEPTPPNAPKLFIEYPDQSTIQTGVPFTGKIILGEEDNPVFNAYGLAFNLRYDQAKIRILNIQYPPGWFGEAGDDLLTIDRTFNTDGLAHVGISRNNKENVTGHGQIAEFIGIIEDIVQRTDNIDMEIDGIVAISKEEFPVPIGGSISKLQLEPNGVIDLPEGTLSVFPNPTNDKVYFTLTHGQKIDFVEVTSADGKVLETLKPTENHLTLNHYAPGMYVLKFMIDGQPFYDRIVKQ